MVEADIKGLFANLAHEGLWKMLALRIDDKPFLGLIQQWRKAGILDTDGQILYPEEGSPQGGSLSPVRATGYLPYAVDLWFEKVVKTHCQGEALSCRYADDFVCAFRYRAEAERFFRVLPKRLNKFGLDVAPDKPRILRVSRFHPSMKRRFVFLGFELYWYPDRQGVVRVMRRTARNCLPRACRNIKAWIRAGCNPPSAILLGDQSIG
jgi:retron-type reverse transcriptase